ncbi:MAG TPA: hypothetical protein PKD23_09350 [Bellilinea sp.]|nr:hypothetical protein [Bellilinea sp.]
MSDAPLLDKALANVDTKFRSKVISNYLELKKRFQQASYDNSYDASGLSAGKFCENILRLLQFQLTGTYIPFGQKIPNFLDEVDKLQKLPSSKGNESSRIIIPRALLFLYTLRNKRGIGHVGGDVEANQIDASTIVKNADWVICELIRIYHQLSLEEAQDIVDSISAKNLPDIWEVNGKKRILREGLAYKDKVLLLAYSEPQTSVMVEDLFTWTEYSNYQVFIKKVITSLHEQRLIEYDQETRMVHLSPKGIQLVESTLLLG